MRGITVQSIKIILRIHCRHLLPIHTKHGRVLLPKAIIALFQRGHVPSKEELAPGSSVPTVRTLHVSIDATKRDVEIEVECKDYASEEGYEGGEGSVFKVGKLNFHAAEFSAPSNVGIVGTATWRRRLPANGLPVCALNALKVLCLSFIIHFFNGTFEDDQRVPNKDMSNMLREERIDARFPQVTILVLINGDRNVIVYVQNSVGHMAIIGLALKNIGADGIISTFIQTPVSLACNFWIWFRSSLSSPLCWSPIIHALANNPPSTIRICQPPPQHWCTRRQRHHDWRHHCQLIK
mmetsp:Transcript_16196/g.27657  ORF Transcript_16196/g.27657 Transcript_16196/m.27657 type:complete len:294 (-) Transcript_16196:554-1435(-)